MSTEGYVLSNAERETIITRSNDEDHYHVTAEIPAFARMLQRRGYTPGPDGFFRIPVKALVIRSASSLQDRALTPKRVAAIEKQRERLRAGGLRHPGPIQTAEPDSGS